MLISKKVKELVSVILDGKGYNVRIVRMPFQSKEEFSIVVCCNSRVHVNALANRIIHFSKDIDLDLQAKEGLNECNWVILDFGILAIHIFLPEVLKYYDLENFYHLI